ncbi:hypothetical protein ACH5RR_033673 [Cinchona calisaya]|uniref:DUF4218 domain-containing protein n=1 Tax=Cinchona calisaya TaxID=153742 RepID=A0ABD2Y8P7_9GENT
MGIRSDLHAVKDGTRKMYLPYAFVTFDKKGKEIFYNTLKNVKVPDGYASNISKCVQLKPPKLSGFKSHDYHILMLLLLPISLRKTLPKSVRIPLIQLSRYFRDLCFKILKPQDLARMDAEILLILCQLEKVFPPSFFDVMVHLSVHLSTEAKMGGLVHYRWMYPIKR